MNCTLNDNKLQTNIFFKDENETFILNVFYPYFRINEQGEKDINTKITNIDIFAGNTSVSSSTSEIYSVDLIRIMSTLEITIELNDYQSDCKFFISGLRHKGTFNIYTCNITVDENENTNYQYDFTNAFYSNNTSSQRVYTLHVIPQKASNMEVTALINGITFISKLSNAELEPAWTYSYTINLTKPTNTFTKSNEFTNFNSITSMLSNGLTYSLTLIYSYSVSHSLTISLYMINTYKLTIIDSVLTYITTKFITYNYIFAQYPSEYSYYTYLNFYNQNNNNNGISSKLLIGIICASAVVILLIVGIIIYVFRKRQNINFTTTTKFI